MGNKFFREFCETTSCDGFSHLYRNKHIGWKLLWSAVIALAFAGAFYEIWKVFDDFRNKPISTYYQIKQTNNGVDFPDVVLCNSNIVNSSKVKESKIPVEIINAILSMYPNDNRVEVMRTFFPPTDFVQNEQLDEKLAALNDSSITSILMNISYEQKKFIRSCFYQKELCQMKNISISSIKDSDYGICFLIRVKSAQYMPKSGLTLLLDVHSELWWTQTPSFTSGVSIKLEKEYDPATLKNLHVSPGYYSQISLKLMHHKMYDNGKNSTCSNDMDRQILKTKYSVELCRSECFLKKVYKNCACVPAVPREHLINSRIPFCITAKRQFCLRQLMSSPDLRISLVNCSRQCLPKCDYWSYSSSVTAKKFPAFGVKSVLTRLNNVSMDEYRLDDYMLIDVSLEEIQVSSCQSQYITSI